MLDNTDISMIIAAAVCVAGGIVVGLVLRALFGRFAGLGLRNIDRSWAQYGWSMTRGVTLPVTAAAGAWAAAEVLRVGPPARAIVDQLLLVIVVLAVVLTGARVAGSIVGAVAIARAGPAPPGVAQAGAAQSASIFVNITRVVVVAIGILVLLQSLGVSITPMLTALGVGGLAVALALQDTLANLFGGVQILASKKVQPGDFIRLDSGEDGYVVDINWRNTSVRQLAGNIVLIPNSRFADAVLTNFHQPMQDMSVLVQVGVGYGSDLEHVEEVTAEIGREVMREVEGAVPDHEPFIRYHTFGDHSIQFSVILRASEFTAQYLIQHEFIKRLHRRYRSEGIEIPFPVRTLVTPDQPARPLGRERPFALPGARRGDTDAT